MCSPPLLYVNTEFFEVSDKFLHTLISVKKVKEKLYFFLESPLSFFLRVTKKNKIAGNYLFFFSLPDFSLSCWR